MRARPAADRGGPRRARLAAPLLPLIAAACVTTYEPIDEVGGGGVPLAAEPVAIPIPDLGPGGNRLLLDFYSGILRRLQEAADDGDVALLDSLVETYDKSSLPDSIREHLAGYRAIARGIAFQQHLARSARLELAPSRPDEVQPEEAPALGEDLLLRLTLPPMARPVRLGGYGDQYAIGFSIAVTVDDEFFDGQRRSSHTDGFQWLPRTVELVDEGAGSELELPIHIGASAGNVVRRSVTVRVDLMPGYVFCDGLRAPVHRTTVGAGSFTQWPEGHEVLAERPLAALRAALTEFTPEHFASAYLAAVLMPPEQADEAAALLIDQVRFGRIDQAQVAMAALQQVSGLSIAVGDRDGWLTWWQSRAGRRAGR